DVYLVELGKKAPTLLTQHTGDILFQAAPFSADSKSLYLFSDEGGESTALYQADLATKKRTKVLGDKWDVDSADVSNTGRYFTTEINEHGAPKLTVTERGKRVVLPAPPGQGAAWRELTFSRSDRFVGVTLVSDPSPATAYVIDLKNASATRLVDPMP